jgi:hypothetical protein
MCGDCDATSDDLALPIAIANPAISALHRQNVVSRSRAAECPRVSRHGSRIASNRVSVASAAHAARRQAVVADYRWQEPSTRVPAA